MTAQLAANHLPAVNAAFGLNNAPPFTWTPEEMLGGSEGGVRKPLLLMVGRRRRLRAKHLHRPLHHRGARGGRRSQAGVPAGSGTRRPGPDDESTTSGAERLATCPLGPLSW